VLTFLKNTRHTGHSLVDVEFFVSTMVRKHVLHKTGQWYIKNALLED